MNLRKKSICFSGITVVVPYFVLKLVVQNQTDDGTPSAALSFCSRLLLDLWGQIPITQQPWKCERQGRLHVRSSGISCFFLLFCLINFLRQKPHRPIQDAVPRAAEKVGLAHPGTGRRLWALLEACWNPLEYFSSFLPALRPAL